MGGPEVGGVTVSKSEEEEERMAASHQGVTT